MPCFAAHPPWSSSRPPLATASWSPDDNHDAADSLAELLRLAHFEVQTAYDGAEAVRVASTFQPDVAVLDLNMPVLDGFAAAAALQRLGSPPLLVAFSADGRPETMGRVEQAGFYRYFTKPADTERLVALLRSAARSD